MDGSTLQQLETQPRRRRRSLRRAVHLETAVRSELWDGPVSLVATDLSLHGIWLEADFPLEVGSELSMSFTLPRLRHATPLHARGRVVRVGLLRRRTDTGRAGMGVSFLELRSEQSERLSRALRGVPPPVPRPNDEADRIARVASFYLADRLAFTFFAEAPLLTADRITALGPVPPGSPMTAIIRTRRALRR